MTTTTWFEMLASSMSIYGEDETSIIGSSPSNPITLLAQPFLKVPYSESKLPTIPWQVYTSTRVYFSMCDTANYPFISSMPLAPQKYPQTQPCIGENLKCS